MTKTNIPKPTRDNYTCQDIEWQGIGVKVRYCVMWSSTLKDSFQLAHLEIISHERQRLPMTETGYKSHFIHPSGILSAGGAVAYVQLWLKEESKNSAWADYVERSRQGQLF